MNTNKKYLRPGFLLTKIINPLLIKLNMIPVLTVKGRKSGKWIKTPVTPIEYENETYLVAPRGETQWVRNLRKENNGKLTIKGKKRDFNAVEISGSLQKLVVMFYQKQVTITKSQFNLLPDPQDHPVFKLEFRIK